MQGFPFAFGGAPAAPAPPAMSRAEQAKYWAIRAVPLVLILGYGLLRTEPKPTIRGLLRIL
jgi:hypothetical protein